MLSGVRLQSLETYNWAFAEIAHSVPSVGGTSIMREAHPSAHPAQAFPTQRGHSLRNARATRKVSGTHRANVRNSFPHTHSQETRDNAGPKWRGEDQVTLPRERQHLPQAGERGHLAGSGDTGNLHRAFGWRQKSSVNCQEA